MTKKAKIALASGGVGLLALAVVLGVWQPWKEGPEETQDPLPQQQEETKIPAEEEGLTLSVGGKKISCTLYTWENGSVYVPEGWTAEKDAASGLTVSLDEDDSVYLRIQQDDFSEYVGDFVSISTQGENALDRLFYTTDASGIRWEVHCRAPRDIWADYEKLMTAMARTVTIGTEQPFAETYILPSEPGWQITDGVTVLWLDKDGYVVDDGVAENVERYMLSWPDEEKGNYTGQYRMENLAWAGSYAQADGICLDTFVTTAQYEIVSGREAEIVLAGDQEIVDGWLVAPDWFFYVTVTHDGSAVLNTEIDSFYGCWPGDAVFASYVLQKTDGQ